MQVTIESPDLDFVYSDSDQYDAEIAGSLYMHIVVSTLQCVSKKTSPTFFAVTLESIVGFSYCLAHMLLRK